jgi:YVTN family beta-propeller protein
LITHSGDEFVTVRDGQTAKEIKRIKVGPSSANVGFTPDSKTAYVAVTGANAVAVVDVASLTVIKDVPVGNQPTGLIVMVPP